MKRIVLFSAFTPSNREIILDKIFPVEIQNKVLAYMPSGGISGAEVYIQEWRTIAKTRGAVCNVIDNSVRSPQQLELLLSSNIVVISGGNTFNLLRNLRSSGLDKAIEDFAKKPEFVLAGFSAGALVLTPTIAVCNLPSFDENLAGLDDLTGLGLVNFEVFPHYQQTQDAALQDYRKTASNTVKEITDEAYICIDR